LVLDAFLKFAKSDH